MAEQNRDVKKWWLWFIPRAISTAAAALVFVITAVLVIGLLVGVAAIAIGLIAGVLTLILTIITAVIALLVFLVGGLIGLVAALALVPFAGLAYVGLYLFAIHPALIAIPIIVFLFLFGGIRLGIKDGSLKCGWGC